MGVILEHLGSGLGAVVIQGAMLRYWYLESNLQILGEGGRAKGESRAVCRSYDIMRRETMHDYKRAEMIIETQAIKSWLAGEGDQGRNWSQSNRIKHIRYNKS
jgi:hypothetical protein